MKKDRKMKVVIIGAGSAFGSRLSVDILSRECLQDSHIALCDIHEGRLEAVHSYVSKVVKGNGLSAELSADTDRRKVLANADYVIISVAVGGPAYYGRPYEDEINIPLKYGIFQTVGDSVGPGGIFRALRTAPALIDMTRDIEELAPGAMIINYTNPMAALTWILQKAYSGPVVGLCHSVQGTSKKLAGYLDIPYDEVGYRVAGINHMAWFLEFTHKGSDVYPRLREAMRDREIYSQDPVRFEVMKNFGYFVTESSRHMAEYLPYYQHRKDLLEAYVEMRKSVKEKRENRYEEMGLKAKSDENIELVRSHEYASGIIETGKTGGPMKFNGNVPNAGLISNLPQNCIVEVQCLVDGEGVHPCYAGALPPQCAALCRSNVSVQELMVKAALERDADAAYHALCLDPSTSANLHFDGIGKMFDELWEAEGELLSAYNRRRSF